MPEAFSCVSSHIFSSQPFSKPSITQPPLPPPLHGHRAILSSVKVTLVFGLEKKKMAYLTQFEPPPGQPMKKCQRKVGLCLDTQATQPCPLRYNSAPDPWDLRFGVCFQSAVKNVLSWGFPGGLLVKNLPANAGDPGSSPDPGRSYMRQDN